MGTAADDYDPLYLKGIAYFNSCEFFEAHEVWEDLWKSYTGPLRLFYKGLIQAAVASTTSVTATFAASQGVRQQSRLPVAILAELRRARLGKISG